MRKEKVVLFRRRKPDTIYIVSPPTLSPHSVHLLHPQAFELVWQYRIDADAECTHQGMYSEYRNEVEY